MVQLLACQKLPQRPLETRQQRYSVVVVLKSRMSHCFFFCMISTNILYKKRVGNTFFAIPTLNNPTSDDNLIIHQPLKRQQETYWPYNNKRNQSFHDISNADQEKFQTFLMDDVQTTIKRNLHHRNLVTPSFRFFNEEVFFLHQNLPVLQHWKVTKGSPLCY